MNPRPFHPETAQKLRARFFRAVSRAVDPSVPVGADPDHIFDFYSGLRLVVSVELLDGTAARLILSASAFPGSKLFVQIDTQSMSFRRFCQLAREAYRSISGDHGRLQPLGVSRKGAPYWAGAVAETAREGQS